MDDAGGKVWREGDFLRREGGKREREVIKKKIKKGERERGEKYIPVLNLWCTPPN
jgi:hypothetical protein